MQSFLSKARVPFMGSLLAALAVLSGCARVEMGTSGQKDKSGSAGSSQCRTCHPGFYKKWATSHHGLAMQPFTAEFAKASLRPQDSALTVGAATYQAVFEAEGGFQEEKGPKGVRRLPMVQVMGGKNTYYFLTPMERGRLQVLPLAYDVQKQQWYDMAASGVRMHAEGHSQRPLEWTDSAYTFNTACYSCHVSQLRTNYDLASDTYHSSWREPGINCETCHGDGAAHVALYENDLTAKHEDMRILRTTRMTPAQRNEMCAPCHAKMSPISAGYEATQRFFDHYDLVTLEDPDYYPDGRDLGENYTFTSWLMSPCIRNGKFDCIHCHTSSGRYRFATENPNGACQPCHQDVVAKVEAHSHHKAGTPGGNCIDCHMPKTRFANMNRSDHSMLPPTPAVTMKHQSPNACNLCHKNKPASWADAKVRQWFPEDYQKPVLARAALVDQARRGRWGSAPGDDRLRASARRRHRDASFAAPVDENIERPGQDAGAHPGARSCEPLDPGRGGGLRRRYGERGNQRCARKGDGGRVPAGADSRSGLAGRHAMGWHSGSIAPEGRECDGGVGGLLQSTSGRFCEPHEPGQLLSRSRPVAGSDPKL